MHGQGHVKFLVRSLAGVGTSSASLAGTKDGHAEGGLLLPREALQESGRVQRCPSRSAKLLGTVFPRTEAQASIFFSRILAQWPLNGAGLKLNEALLY